MGLLQAPGTRHQDDSTEELYEQHRPFRFALPREAGEFATRHEPHSLIERRIPADPYVAWLQQREAEAEREREARPQIRLVHRHARGIVARRL